MAAHLEEPSGKEAGRVTIVTTLTSMLPTIFTCIMIVVEFLIGMISAEIAAAMLLTALGLGSAISGTVFGTPKHTPTDKGKTVYSSGGYDQVVPTTAPLPDYNGIHGDVDYGAPVPPTTARPVATGSTALATEEPLRRSNGDAAARMRGELQAGAS